MGKRRVMCVSDMQGEECHANERANCCYCLLTKRSCVLEKQTIQTSTAIMNDLTRIGDYELLENEHLMRYIDVVKKDDELWVVIPSRVDRIDCNGEL